MATSSHRSACSSVAVVSILSLGLAVTARAELPAYDGFDYAPRFNLDQAAGGIGWTTPWQDVAFDLVTRVEDPGLQFGDLLTTPGAAVTPPATGAWNSATYERSYGPLNPTDDHVYISFLLRPDAEFGVYGGITLGTWPHEVFVGSPIGYYTYGFMIGDGLITVSNVPLVQDQTVLLVTKLEVNPATGHTSCRLYVNPDPRQPEPAFADVAHAAPWPLLPTGLYIDNEGGFTTDEMRIGRTWEEVVPTTPGCPADITGNGDVGFADLVEVLSTWGPCPAACGADVNEDGTVGFDDLLLVLSNWGPCP